jgi:thioredoxin-like negative regulator of GroEL
MKRLILRHGARLVVVALASACATAFAQAEVDEKCMAQWHDAIAAEAVGTACKVGDAASMAKLKAAEDAALNCGVAKMSPEQVADVRASAAKTKVELAKQMSSGPCPPEAKSYFQQRSRQMQR